MEEGLNLEYAMAVLKYEEGIQKYVSEACELRKRIQELEEELQVAVVVHKKLEEQIDAFEMDGGHAAARIKELEERIAFMEASAAPEKTIDILIK